MIWEVACVLKELVVCLEEQSPQIWVTLKMMYMECKGHQRLNVSDYWSEKWMRHVQRKQSRCAHTEKDGLLSDLPEAVFKFISDPHLAWCTKNTESVFIEWVTGYKGMKIQLDLKSSTFTWNWVVQELQKGMAWVVVPGVRAQATLRK